METIYDDMSAEMVSETMALRATEEPRLIRAMMMPKPKLTQRARVCQHFETCIHNPEGLEHARDLCWGSEVYCPNPVQQTL